MIWAFAFLLSLNAFADYAPTLKALADGEYNLFRDLAFEELQKESSVAKKRELLKVISLNKKKFYDVDLFRGVVLPFNNSDCKNKSGGSHICSKYKNYEFLLEDLAASQVFSIRDKEHILLTFPTDLRLKLDSPKTTFGKALHLFFNARNPSKFYLFIREIEAPQNSKTILLHTINVFRINGSEVCRLLESNVTGNENQYELITEYIRTFGEKTKCSPSVLLL